MEIYTFGANITVQGIDYEDAINNFDQISKVFGILDTDVFDIEQIGE